MLVFIFFCGKENEPKETARAPGRWGIKRRLHEAMETGLASLKNPTPTGIGNLILYRVLHAHRDGDGGCL
jgi:hypothetical protein